MCAMSSARLSWSRTTVRKTAGKAGSGQRLARAMLTAIPFMTPAQPKPSPPLHTWSGEAHATPEAARALQVHTGLPTGTTCGPTGLTRSRSVNRRARTLAGLTASVNSILKVRCPTRRNVKDHLFGPRRTFRRRQSHVRLHRRAVQELRRMLRMPRTVGKRRYRFHPAGGHVL